MFIFIMEVFPSNFFVVSFLLTPLWKGYFLRQLLLLTFLNLSVTIENVSFTSKALLGDNASTLCSVVIPNFNCFQLFATSGFVNEIVAFTHAIHYVDIHDA